MTTNARSAETFTVVAVFVERSVPCGVTRTETMPSPCLPLGVPPVDAPPRRSSRMRERARADEVGVRDELRRRDDDARDALVLQLLRRGHAVELLPDDVARGQQLALRPSSFAAVSRSCPSTRARAARACRRGPASPFARSSIASTRFWCIARSGPGARICCACVVRLLLLLRELLQLRLEVGLLQRRTRRARSRTPRRASCRPSRSPSPCRRTTGTRRACSCPGTSRPRRRGRRRRRSRSRSGRRAARAGRSPVGVRIGGRGGRSPPPPPRRRALQPRQPPPLGRLDGLGLVEEVELDVVVVVFAHAVTSTRAARSPARLYSGVRPERK